MSVHSLSRETRSFSPLGASLDPVDASPGPWLPGRSDSFSSPHRISDIAFASISTTDRAVSTPDMPPRAVPTPDTQPSTLSAPFSSPSLRKKRPPSLFAPVPSEPSPERDTLQTPRDPYLKVQIGALPENMERILEEALSKPDSITPNRGGKNGSFIVSHQTRPILCMKPEQNERGTQFNGQLRNESEGMVHSKDGVQPGESAITEMVAYLYIKKILELLDIPSDLMTVPTTAYGAFASKDFFQYLPRGAQTPYSVEKNGTIQIWELNCKDYTTDDAQLLSGRVAIALALIDILLMNTDRNKGNLLVQTTESESKRLLLIDHGCCLPREGLSAGTFAWKNGAKDALTQPTDETTVRIIQSLTPDILASIVDECNALVGKEKFAHERLRTHEMAIALLQEGTKAGLSLYEIACLFDGTGGEFGTTPNNAIFQLLSPVAISGLKTPTDLIDRYKATLNKLHNASSSKSQRHQFCGDAKRECRLVG